MKFLKALTFIIVLQYSLFADDFIPNIVVFGNSEIKVAPDNSRVIFTIQSENEKPKIAQNTQRQRLESIQKIFDDGNITKEQIQILNMNFYETIRYYSNKSDKNKKIFVASTSFSVLLNDTNSYVSLLEKVIDFGASRTEIIFESSKVKEIKEQARIKAVKEAMKKADYMAQASNSNIKRVLEIEELPTFSNHLGYKNYRGEYAKTDEGGGIEVGEIKISAKVRLKLELE